LGREAAVKEGVQNCMERGRYKTLEGDMGRPLSGQRTVCKKIPQKQPAWS
jgi:hypothetical protein